MRRSTRLSPYLVLLSFLGACSSYAPQPFVYPYYVVTPTGYLGETPEGDLGPEACAPQGECVMMKSEVFFRLKADFLKKGVRLIWGTRFGL